MAENLSRAARVEHIQSEIERLRGKAALAAISEVRLAYLELARILARAAKHIEQPPSRQTHA